MKQWPVSEYPRLYGDTGFHILYRKD